MLYAIYKDNKALGYYTTEREAREFTRIYRNQFPTSNITIVELPITEMD